MTFFLKAGRSAGRPCQASKFGWRCAGAEFGGEIAQAGVGLPQDEAVILDRRHQPVRVHREIGGVLLGAPVRKVDVLVRHTEFVDAPHHFLDVGR